MVPSLFRRAAKLAGPPASAGAVPECRDNASSDAIVYAIAGVGADVRVATDFGPVPAMLLRENDRLQSPDGEFARVKDIRTMAFDASCLTAYPGALAVLIEAGSLGAGIPRVDITVAPQQMIAADPDQHGADYVCAEDCLGMPGVHRHAPVETVYHVPACGEPAVILAEGLRILV